MATSSFHTSAWSAFRIWALAAMAVGCARDHAPITDRVQELRGQFGQAVDPAMVPMGGHLVFFSSELITSFSLGMGTETPGKPIHEFIWKTRERPRDAVTYADSAWKFTTDWRLVSGDSLVDGEVCLVGVDSNGATILEVWKLRGALGGFLAGRYSYPPGPNGFEPRFTREVTTRGRPFDSYRPPEERDYPPGFVRKRLLEQSLPWEPIGVTAYPNGEDYWVLFRSKEGQEVLLKHVWVFHSHVLMRHVTDSVEIPWLVHAESVDVAAYLQGTQGYLLALSGGYVVDDRGVGRHHDEYLIFEDRNGDATLERFTLFEDEGRFLEHYAGQLIHPEGPLGLFEIGHDRRR